MIRLPRDLHARLAAGLLALGAGAAAAAPLLAVGSATAFVGTSVTVAVSVTGAAPDLSSWQFDLWYDPLYLRAERVTEGAMFPSFGNSLFGSGVIDPNAGLISLVNGAFADIGQAPFGSGVLANVEFTVLRSGPSDLTLANAFLNLSADGFSTRDGDVLGRSTGSASEPGALALALAALAALTAARRPSRPGLGALPT